MIKIYKIMLLRYLLMKKFYYLICLLLLLLMGILFFNCYSNSILLNSNLRKIEAVKTVNKVKNQKLALININTAGVDELTKLTGIGNKKALEIIEYRNKNGKFTNIEDIKKVKGIGEKSFNKIKDRIALED